jgi:hypothetical protein
MNYFANDLDSAQHELAQMKHLSPSAKENFIDKVEVTLIKSATAVAGGVRGATASATPLANTVPFQFGKGSCADNCGNNRDECFCDAHCLVSHDCCADFDTACGEDAVEVSKAVASDVATGTKKASAEAVPTDSVISMLMAYLARDPSGSAKLMTQSQALTPRAKLVFTKKLGAKLARTAKSPLSDTEDAMIGALMDYLSKDPSTSEHLLMQLQVLSSRAKKKFISKLEVTLISTAAEASVSTRTAIETHNDVSKAKSSLVASIGTASCAKHCGKTMNDCHCDPLCLTARDCCADFTTQCETA